MTDTLRLTPATLNERNGFLKYFHSLADSSCVRQ